VVESFSSLVQIKSRHRLPLTQSMFFPRQKKLSGLRKPPLMVALSFLSRFFH
jgi:hypothetical protein